MNGCFNMIGGQAPRLNFTFDGSMTPVVYDDEGNWEFSILDTGNLVFKSDPGRIDVFMVGGGAGGATGSSTSGIGGGGGYTKNVFGISVVKRQSYTIAIGAGGAVNTNGGNTTAFGYTASGGKSGSNGGHGGSGAGGWGEEVGGNGGSDGYDGSTGDDIDGDENDYAAGGKGQRNQTGDETTTRAFRESDGMLCSGGGGGYGSQTKGSGGAGGGGACGVKGTANLGGGGGAGAAGGSGRVIIRNAR